LRGTDLLTYLVTYLLTNESWIPSSRHASFTNTKCAVRVPSIYCPFSVRLIIEFTHDAPRIAREPGSRAPSFHRADAVRLGARVRRQLHVSETTRGPRPYLHHEDEIHRRTARGGHGVSKVLLGPAMPDPFTPSGRASPETALRPFQRRPASVFYPLEHLTPYAYHEVPKFGHGDCGYGHRQRDARKDAGARWSKMNSFWRQN
jgi:hypothetical protein